MKKNLLFLFALPFLLMLSGCPYNSKVPLSAPKTPIDRSLLGVWEAETEKGEEDSVEVRIYEFNKNEYYIDLKAFSAKKIEADYYRGYITPVGTVKIMNLESLKEKGEYNFFRYKPEGNNLIISVVSDISLTEKYDRSEKMAKAFAAKINGKDFFETDLKLKRKQ